MNLDKLKNIIQDCNINFLFGSGMSAPFLTTLGSIEVLLTESNEITDEEQKNIITSSLYKLYFDGVIKKNLAILNSDSTTNDLINSYKYFFEIFNKIILERRNTLLSKQINVFTTNIDICLEKSLESKGFEYNDGFSGNFQPRFDLSNYKKSLFKRSLHFENISEIPVFNIYKIHGSLTWKLEDEKIVFANELQQINKTNDISISENTMIQIEKEDNITSLKTKAESATYNEREIKNFMEEYEKLSIVNPTKDKFRETILNQTYYELLRIYANELEKENTVLFVMGFSFADEHIKELTLRVANSNPTLMIYIIAYDKSSKDDFEEKMINLKHNNIEIISPNLKEDGSEEFLYTFAEINSRIFKSLELKIIEG